jgi:hypothetical protein
MALIIPTEVKSIYVSHWVIPTIEAMMKNHAASTIQHCWKSEIVGHFMLEEYTDGFGHFIRYFGYDRYKNIYEAYITQDKLSIKYTKFEESFESLLDDDDVPDCGHPNWVCIVFDMVPIRYSGQDEDVYVHFVPFAQDEVFSWDGYTQQFRLACLEKAYNYKII